MSALPTPQAAAAPPGAAVREHAAAAGRPLRVAFCGPIARSGEAAAGGYEAANRRTCDALRRRGVDVLELPYPRTGASGPAGKALAYAACYLRLGQTLLTGRGRYDLVHLTPLNQRFAWAEHLLLRCARAAGRPVLMDVRAGTFMSHYQQARPTYRRVVDASLRLAGRVAVEGECYLDFVAHRHRHAPLYLPNFVESDALETGLHRAPPRAGHPVRLLYVGRVVAEKGIAEILQAARALGLLGWHCIVDIVGAGPSAQIRRWQSDSADLEVLWHGALAPQALRAVLAEAHVFVFASRHIGEGHANALNEAMAAGVVPVCSDQGFSAAVVGPAGVVLPRDSAGHAYAQAIDRVLIEGRWLVLSAAARERARSLYSEDANLPALMATYRAMLARPD